MGDARAANRADTARAAYAAEVERPGVAPPLDRWYQDNTREPIRDETLKDGLVQAGAVVDEGRRTHNFIEAAVCLCRQHSRACSTRRLPARSWMPPSWPGRRVTCLRVRWRGCGLRGRAAAAAGSKVLVTLPNGEVRQMEAGPSSVITKAVVEVFARRFLTDPAVLWISESGAKVVQRDDALARGLGLHIEADRVLPDMVLVDLAPADPLVVFVEVVATDGPVTQSRRVALMQLLAVAGFKPEQGAFVTAFADRDSSAFRRGGA